MANKTKQALRVDNNQSFPDNNTGFITPEKLRTFQLDIIDSFVNNDDSGSLTFDSGSLLTTASATGATIEFTKGDGSTFDVTVTAQATNTGSLLQTASFNEYTESTDDRLTNIELETSSLQGRVSSIETFTSSVDTKFATLASTTSSLNTFTSSADNRLDNIENNTGSYARTDTTNQFQQTQTLQQDLIVEGNLYVSGAEVIISSSELVVGDRIIEVNANRVIGDAGIYAFDAVGDQTGSLIWNPNLDYWLAGLSGSEEKVLVSSDTGSIQNSITQLDLFTQSAEGRLDNIEQTTASLENSISELNTFTASQEDLNSTFATTGSNTFEGNQTINGNLQFGSVADIQGNDFTFNVTSNIDFNGNAGNYPIEFNDFSSLDINNGNLNVSGDINYRLTEGFVLVGNGNNRPYEVNTGSFASTGSFNTFTASQEDLNGTFATTGSNTFEGAQTISTGNFQALGVSGFRGFRIVDGNSGDEIATNGDGSLLVIASDLSNAASLFKTSAGTYAQNVFEIAGGGAARDTGFALDLKDITGNGYSGSGWFATSGPGNYYDVFHLQDSRNYTNGDITFKVPVVVDNTFTASLTEGHILVGDSNDTTTEIPTGSFATTGSNTFTATQTISGSTLYEVVDNTIISQTSSIDFSATSIQTITLVSGSTTHLLPTNVDKGQTTNLLIKQPSVGTGSIEFAPQFLQATGSEYIPTPSQDAKDILTFITFDDETEIYVSNITEFV